MKEIIPRFEFENRFLSNFHQEPEAKIPLVDLAGIVHFFNCVEIPYQASKCVDVVEQINIMRLDKPGASQKKGSFVKCRDDWDIVKFGVMYDLVNLKFRVYPHLGDRLLATGDAWLIEGNNHKDTIWGRVDGKGYNMLGSILMIVRGGLANG